MWPNKSISMADTATVPQSCMTIACSSCSPSHITEADITSELLTLFDEVATVSQSALPTENDLNAPGSLLHSQCRFSFEVPLSKLLRITWVNEESKLNAQMDSWRILPTVGSQTWLSQLYIRILFTM